MAKKKKVEIKVEKKIEKKVAKPTTKKRETPTPKWIIPFILLLTFVAYIPALSAQYVNWDDGDYTTGNYLIRSFSYLPELIRTPVQGNYHPLTMISLAINYAISGSEAWSYHLFNILFHLINCYLVFRLAMVLSKRNLVIAFTTAVLFGVHPMHVESVAWISERKDVLYTIFFVAGLIAYTKYVDTNSKKQLWLAVFFAILSLLSKPAAIVFPGVLFCIDILRKRKLNLKLIAEKIPFFIPAAILAYLTFTAQTKVGATGADLTVQISGVELFSTTTRILMAFYGILMYFVKLLFPFNLTAFYPYEPVNEKLPLIYYLSPIFSLVLAVLFYLSMKKDKVIAFGISFYVANLILVIQLIPVGSAVIAERYTYVPYIGVFYVLGWLLDKYAVQKLQKALYIIVPISLFLSFLTFRQSAVWHDGATLWDNAIKSYPNSKVYSLRATLLRTDKEYQKAIGYYTKAVGMNAIDHESYNNRGNCYFDLKKYDSAYADYKKALEINPTYYTTLDNMGGLLSTLQKYDSALYYVNKAIEIKPDYKPVYLTRGLTLMSMKRYPEAIKDFETRLKLEPDNADDYNTIGVCYRAQTKFQESLAPITKAIELNPKPEFYMNRSYSYFGLKNMEQAKKDALMAKQGGIALDPPYASLLGIQ